MSPSTAMGNDLASWRLLSIGTYMEDGIKEGGKLEKWTKKNDEEYSFSMSAKIVRMELSFICIRFAYYCFFSFCLQKMFTKEIEALNVALQEERFRSERLEEQINDLTELHQNEVENLKQAICDMEEKVQYQSEERLRDIHEMLESCQTKVNFCHDSLARRYFTNSVLRPINIVDFFLDLKNGTSSSASTVLNVRRVR